MFPADMIKVKILRVAPLWNPPLIALTPSQTRMQVFTASPAAMYTGIGNAFSRISATEGLRALWRGVSSVILGAGPAHAVHFGTYEFIKELTGGNERGSHWVSTGELGFLVRPEYSESILPSKPPPVPRPRSQVTL